MLCRASCTRYVKVATSALCKVALLLLVAGSFRLHAQEDGGVTISGQEQLLESLYVPNLGHAPFSLKLSAEWIRPLIGGGTYTGVNSRPIIRDSAGRIYQERWLLEPKDAHIRSRMSWIQIEDPVAGVYYQCSARVHVCEEKTAVPEPVVLYDPNRVKAGPLPGGKGVRTHEDLGVEQYMGIEVHHYRDTMIFNPGTMGNSQPMTVMREFRYSPMLGINLTSILETPLIGRQIFTVTEINMNEPDPSFFKPPEGYRVVDKRTPVAVPQ